MRHSLRGKLTFANVTAALALWVALSTGAAYAANTVFSADIVNGEVKTQDLGNASVTTKKVANNAIKGSKVSNGSLLGADLAANSIGGVRITDGSLETSDLADNSVTSAKILNETVGQTDIATDGVGASEIADNTIDAGEIVDFGLTNQDIGVLFAEVNANGTLANSSGSVTTLKLGGSGNYEVDFARNIVSCTAVGTVAPAGGGSALGELNVADRGGNAEAVFVDTNNSDGTAADKPFRLVVVC